MDFSKCLFNPNKKDLFVAYPNLMTIKGITEKLMRYIIMVYDYNSPLVKEHRDLKLRKQEAAKLSGYDLDKDRAYLDLLYALRDDIALKAVDKFLKEFIHSRLWYRICGDEHLYWEAGLRMLKSVETDDSKDKDSIASLKAKAELGENMQEIDLRLDAAYKKLYGDDIVHFIRKPSTPETIAQERRNNV